MLLGTCTIFCIVGILVKGRQKLSTSGSRKHFYGPESPQQNSIFRKWIHTPFSYGNLGSNNQNRIGLDFEHFNSEGSTTKKLH